MADCYKQLSNIQGRAFALVINAPSDQVDPQGWLEALGLMISQQAPARGFEYWVIIHDSDLEDDFQTPKRVHMHCVLRKGNPTRGSVIINFINDLVGLDKGQLPPWLSIDLVRSLRGALRYLVHLDNPDKWSYFPDDVLTGSLDEFMTACAGELELSTDYLCSVIEGCSGNRVKIAKALGLETYNRLRNTISDFIKTYCHADGYF